MIRTIVFCSVLAIIVFSIQFVLCNKADKKSVKCIPAYIIIVFYAIALILCLVDYFDGSGGVAIWVIFAFIISIADTVACNNFNWPLYNVKSQEINHKNYLLVYCLNDLPNVVTYNLYSDFGRSGDVTYTGNAVKGPFLEIIETPEFYQVTSRAIRYYDENKHEINEDDLVKLFDAAENGDGASVGTAEKGVVYVFLGIILLLGLVVIRYFLYL